MIVASVYSWNRFLSYSVTFYFSPKATANTTFVSIGSKGIGRMISSTFIFVSTFQATVISVFIFVSYSIVLCIWTWLWSTAMLLWANAILSATQIFDVHDPCPIVEVHNFPKWAM